MPCDAPPTNAVQRADLLSLLATDPRLEDQRAACIARWLDTLPAGTPVALYGCGGLGRTLARNHTASLTRLAPVFLSTLLEGTDFEGFPRTDAATIAAAAETDQILRILLLTGTYEAQMRAALPGAASTRALSLLQVVASAGTEAEWQAIEQVVTHRAEEFIGRLKAAIPQGGQAACFVLHNLGSWALNLITELQTRGWHISVVSIGASDTPPDGAGHFDVYHAEPTEPALQAVLLAALSKHQPFKIVHSWAMLQNHAFLHALVELNVPLVASFEDFFPLLAQNEAYGEAFSASQGMSAGQLTEVWRRVYCGCSGVIIKDCETTVRVLEETHGFSNKNILCGIPPVVGNALPGGQHDVGRPIRLCLAQSVHNSFVFSWVGDNSKFLDQIEMYTSLGLHLTLYNNLDNGGPSYEPFRQAETKNKLFCYRQRVPLEVLCAELPRYDFGVLWHHPDMIRRYPMPYRLNFQMKILAYLQAELPILVPAGLTWCRTIVERLGIGLCFEDDATDTLVERLARFDRQACRTRMEEARKLLGMASYAAKLDHFFLSLESRVRTAPAGGDCL